MERLVTTSEAAQLLGLSLQGVHYRIKSGQLKSLKQGGKTFVYVTEFFQQDAKEASKNESNDIRDNQINERIETIVKSKDEQISLLKQSMGFIKEQYQNEIRRLEKNQKRIIKVFNSEIKLLQSAFNEMRSIYKPQIESNLKNKNEEKKADFITVKDFFVLMKRYNKTEQEIKLIIFSRIKNGDRRFVYNKVEKKLLILNNDFLDLI
ncbi:MAG: DNA-binding protein [Deltaproteobacteria bacterium HGW-Deltaproteobacteria-24]|nr:MAG: DNA-binding protein [Deltaproteobacteria bacterium HGW-Deltaproteobacteria-24]